ncbi:hypothetical protein NDI45_22800 [Leptolyngbya sp. GB1-A1]|uniref:hypothetical protein n=1 Tax=Leptolyngbya sp. GB1-A1 TaxID=2933908 RepID=UPI003297A3C5
MTVNSPNEFRLRYRSNQDQHFAEVLEYLNREGYCLPDVVKELLKARFCPAALDASGKLSQRIALDCIGKLKGYIYEIEQLAGIESSSNKSESQLPDCIPDSIATPTAQFDEPEEHEVEVPTRKPVSKGSGINLNSVDRMLGVPSSRSAS